MDHRQLSYFLAVCEARSITGAAAAAHISEQELGKTIRDLEGELGGTALRAQQPRCRGDRAGRGAHT